MKERVPHEATSAGERSVRSGRAAAEPRRQGQAARLQAAGNLAVQRLHQTTFGSSGLRVGDPGGSEERQADQAARRLTGAPAGGAGGSAGSLSRVPSSMLRRLGAGEPLRAEDRDHFAPRLGSRLEGVRIHTGPQAATTARALGAAAFAAGRDVVLGAHPYPAASPTARSVLVHELAHVAQQRHGAPRLQRITAQERIENHTSWGDLKEEALGSELAGLLPGEAAHVLEVLQALGGSDRDDVSWAIVTHSSDSALTGAGNDFMRTLRDYMAGGYTGDDEARAIGRLEQLMGEGEGVEQTESTPDDLSGSASEIVDRFTGLTGLNHDGLGRALASRAVGDPDLLLRVLGAVGATNRDDVAEVIVNSLSAADLAACRDDLLQRLRSELMGRIFSWTSDTEYRAIGRLDAAIRLRTITQPIVSEAPEDAISIEEFLAIIEAEEAKVPPEEQTNTRLMITRLRKLFYGSKGWDEYLIPGAAGVKPLYEFEEVETRRRRIEMPYLPNMVDYVEKQGRLPGGPEALREPSKVQQVRLPDGTFVDLGHVLAGLDALNYPSEVSTPVLSWVGITKNVDAVTWVGDLGSVLAEATLKATEEERYIEPGEYQAIIDEYASPQDMLGNIDAYVIGDAFDISSTAGLKVSEILRQYYLGASAARQKRYTTFAEKVGLGEYKDGVFANEEAWVEFYVDEVNDAAALYLGAGTEGAWPLVGTLLQRGPAVVGLTGNEGARHLLRIFVQALKPLVQAEQAAP